MSYLADTNLLLRGVQENHPLQAVVENAIATLLTRGEQVCITPQNIIKFWSVATRPSDKNGLGLSPAETAQEVAKLKGLLTLLPDNDVIFPAWEKLVTNHQVAGRQVHDARLAAVMIVHGIANLLSFNGPDFKRFPITVIDPATI